MESNSNSFMLYFCLLTLGNLLAYAIGCQLLSYFCLRHAPKHSLLASQCTRVYLIVSKWLFCIAWLQFLFIGKSLCALCSNLFLFSLCDRRGRRGDENCVKLRMKFCRWCILPISDLSCFNVFCGSIFVIVFVLRVVGIIPSGLILCPNHVICLTANLALCRIFAKFSWSSLFSTLFSSASRFESEPYYCYIV